MIPEIFQEAAAALLVGLVGFVAVQTQRVYKSLSFITENRVKIVRALNALKDYEEEKLVFLNNQRHLADIIRTIMHLLRPQFKDQESFLHAKAKLDALREILGNRTGFNKFEYNEDFNE